MKRQREELNKILASTRKRNVADRLDHFSRLLLGRVYLANPIGEGPGAFYDRRALYRFDKFDCLTFAQTVICLALAKNADDFEHINLQMRYTRGRPDFIERNRFVFTQWLPGNIKKGYIVNITNKVVRDPRLLGKRQGVLDYRFWFRETRSDLDECRGERKVLLKELKKINEDNFKVQRQAVKFIPVNLFFIKDGRSRNIGRVDEALIDRIPHGSIIIFRNVGHVHFAVALRKEGKLIIRHACNIHNKMIEDVFSKYYLSVYLFSVFREITIITCNRPDGSGKKPAKPTGRHLTKQSKKN